MRRAQFATCSLAPLALGLATLSACVAGYETVDGYDAVYVEPPPVDVEVYPRYRVSDGYVYDVHGRYYHQHGGRWVTYHSLPRGAVREEQREERREAHRH